MASKNINSTASKLIWAVSIVFFLCFCAALCLLYPLGADEYSYYPHHAEDILQGFLFSYLTNSPRIGIIPARILLYLPDGAFALINPLLQFAVSGLCFYAVFLKWPDFKSLKDYPAFLLILILNVFAVAQPDNNLFWIGGASNYVWPFLLFLPLLIMIRIYSMSGKEIFPRFKYSPLCLFLLAFMLGMSGETLGPVSLILVLLSAAYAKITGKDIPSFIKIAAAGIAAGLAVFFSAPGLYFRLDMEQYDYFKQLPIASKFLNHIPHALKACAANFFLFPITLAILICHYLKQKDFKPLLFPAVMLFLALAAACALALAPIKNLRPFYPATLMTIIAFAYTLTLTKIPLRFITYVFLIFAIIITPLFAAPFVALHKQETLRQAIIGQALKSKRSEVFLNYFMVPKGPYDNLSIYFYDEPVSVRNKYGITTQPADKMPRGQSHIRQF